MSAIEPTPTPTCDPGWILAEDLSCVNPDFYTEPAPVAPAPVAPAPVIEYVETVQVNEQPLTLAATGLNDVSPDVALGGALVLVLGIALVWKAARR